MRKFCLEQTKNVMEGEGLVLDELSQFYLQRAVAAALQRASLKLRDVSDGTIDPRVFAQTITALRQANGEEPLKEPDALPARTSTTLTDLLEGWWREAQAAGRKVSTYKSYRGTMTSFESFLGHGDPGRVTAKDVIAFKDDRLSAVSPKTGKKASAKTVKDSDLAALKAVFGWATNNRRTDSNPATGITVKLGKRPKLRPKGFTDDEARLILRATLTLMPKPEPPATAAAKRWIPWLCAFTGARVGEIAQLRKQDVRSEHGFWIIHVSPEADTVKTNEARDVVLHRQIISQGFAEFVRNSEDGYLFFRVKENNTVPGTKKGRGR